MTRLSKKIELFISITIIVLSVFISEFLLHKYIFSSSSSPEHTQTVNKQITLPDINWSEQPKTVVIALQTNCHFCNESAPFYKRLIENIKGKKIKLVAVLPTAIEKSRAHLDKLGLNDLDIKQASLDSIEVDGTPTLLLVDSKGEVTDYWIGKLPPDKEAEVLSKLIPEG